MSRVDAVMENAVRAGTAFREFTQKDTDRAFRAAFLAGFQNRVRLAKLAVEETGIGLWEHKAVKNTIATLLTYNELKNTATAGVVSEDRSKGLLEVAQPLGPLLGLIPATNPTSTTLFKILIALKSRNPIIISPHNAAKRCITEAARVCCEAARAAGAPEHCVQWFEKTGPSTTKEVMAHPNLALILATGTTRLVREAMASGTPVLGVGPGNVPVYIGESADIPFAVSNIMESKTFDHGTVCASEQAIVVKKGTAGRVAAEFRRQGAHFLSPEETAAIGKVAYDSQRGSMMPGVVGQSALRIAKGAGVTVPPETRVLMAPLEGVGPDHPLSAEILAPILAYYEEPDFDAAIRRCSEITAYGGRGHTAVIYSNTDERIEYFSRVIDAGRILVNMPSTFGALGGTLNALPVSFVPSCGSGGSNTTTDNISVRHLLNIHRIARRNPNPRWACFDQAKLLDDSLPCESLEREYNRNF
ncbi:MAG: aldehyde dehydrogenase family protein [Elusimicrobia bacterium]|nr:aldehyde dehydrogenase family protein [Elusimicrobiota bacterium]